VRFGENRLLEHVATTLDMETETVRDLIARNSLDPMVKGTTGLHEGVDRETSVTLQEILKPAFLKLADEINRTLIYAASQTRGEPVGRIYLLGSLARWRGVDALLSALVRLEVETIPNPLQVFCSGNGRQPLTAAVAAPEIAIATGLAMNGLLEHG
jgi:Tfp pilus assembly PilM family ATPase